MKKILIIAAATFFVSCAQNKNSAKTITVSIDPIGWIVNSLVDSTIEVNILVPAGSSPETYEPTARQVEDLSRSTLYISTGLLDFETELASKIGSIAPATHVINLSDSIKVMAGTCSHTEHDHHGHAHGVDPHIWLSPRAMKKMIWQAAEEIVKSGMNDGVAVAARRDSLLQIVDQVDQYITAKSSLSTQKSFAIVHPSLSYFAADYGLDQIALEIDGKEPSAASIKTIVDQLREKQIATIFYGIQTSDAVAKVVANEVGCTLTPFDPLPKDWPTAMIKITDEIYGTN